MLASLFEGGRAAIYSPYIIIKRNALCAILPHDDGVQDT
jgi:hypothetical protein